jgi:hypothetical protein
MAGLSWSWQTAVCGLFVDIDLLKEPRWGAVLIMLAAVLHFFRSTGYSSGVRFGERLDIHQKMIS